MPRWAGDWLRTSSGFGTAPNGEGVGWADDQTADPQSIFKNMPTSQNEIDKTQRLALILKAGFSLAIAFAVPWLLFHFFVKDASASEYLWSENTAPTNQTYSASSWIILSTADSVDPLNWESEQITRVVMKYKNTGGACTMTGLQIALNDGSWKPCTAQNVSFASSESKEVEFDCSASGATTSGGGGGLLIHYKYAGSGCTLNRTLSTTNTYGGSTTSSHRDGTNSSWDGWHQIYVDDGVPPAPTEAPEILEPDDGEGIAQEVINAVGSEAYRFYVSTGVSAYEWPDESYQYQVEIYDSTPALYCTMDNIAYTANIIDGTHYGTTLQHKVDGQPDPCPNFTQQTYTARLRVDREGGSGWSDWTTPISFTVGETSFDPIIDCPDDPSLFSICWWKKMLYALIWPDEGTTTHLWEKAQELGQVWPLCYITNSVGAVVDSFDQEATDIGTPDAGNIVLGDWPNLAWVLEKAKSFWGGWASVGMGILIWLTAIKIVLNDILGIFGLTMHEDEDEAQPG